MSLLKQTVKKILRLFNIEIITKKNLEEVSTRLSRMTMDGCLIQASLNGLNPSTVIDVGAANGTNALYTTFPNAQHLLIEPLEEFTTALKQITDSLKNSQYFIAAAANYSGEIILNVHPDLFGSSIYKENEESNVNGIERIVPTVTLDEICGKLKTQCPYLIKIDTQGAELDVLKGAQNILQETELVILEVSLFEFFNNGLQLYECIDFMKQKGFVAYEIFDLQYRLLDKAMSQVDIAFVPENSDLRKSHFYATKEQRQKQNEIMTSRLFE